MAITKQSYLSEMVEMMEDNLWGVNCGAPLDDWVPKLIFRVTLVVILT